MLLTLSCVRISNAVITLWSYDDGGDDRFYIVPFSALEQTHCAFVHVILSECL